MILYILAVSPPTEAAWKGVYRSLRPVVLVDDDAYARLVRKLIGV